MQLIQSLLFWIMGCDNYQSLKKPTARPFQSLLFWIMGCDTAAQKKSTFGIKFQSLLFWIMGCDRIFTQPFERVEQSMILGNAFLALETSSFQRFSFEINVR